MNRQVLTIATAKKIYVDYAVNLARSFFLWHPDTDIRFQIATDQPEFLPSDIHQKVDLILIKPKELGEGFSPKLHLDKLASPGQTLFIDSDCLIFAHLDRVFRAFKGHDVSVIGQYINDGEWFGDIKDICKQFNVPHIPKFNGGIYYLEKGAGATAVYEKARALETKYEEIGFKLLRSKPNDEVIMALSMQLHDKKPIADDGTILGDPQACPGQYKINVIKGRRLLVNPTKKHPLHQEWYPFHKVSPIVVHFLGYYTRHYPYKREAYRLYKHLQHDLSPTTELIIFMTIEVPMRLTSTVKNIFRPLYRSLFGFRKVVPSDRI